MSDTPTTLHQTRPGTLFFVCVFLVLSLIILSLIGTETKFSSKGALFAQPRFWPGVAVISMVGFAAAHVLVSLRDRQAFALTEAISWLRALEYMAWFMIYVHAVPYIGYLGATLIFTVLLAYRQGYRGIRQLGLAAALGFVIVVVFKTMLSVKIPGGAIYEYLPGALRNFMIVNF